MNSTKQTGLLTELQCQTYFTQLGYNVSLPLGEDVRYDMIVDVNGKLIKVQVKTCHLTKTESGIEFATRSTQVNTQGQKSKTYSENEIDYFATFWEDKVYLIHVKDCLGKMRTLSFKQQSPNQQDLFWIKNYEAEKTLYRLINNLPEPKTRAVIAQYDKQGNFIAEYSNMTDAAKTLFGDIPNIYNKASHIGKAVNGKEKSAYGFLWKRRFV